MKQKEKPTRLFDIVDIRKHQGRRPCFRFADGAIGADEYIRRSMLLSVALVKRGLRRGEAVALISDNRPEWNIVDVGVLQAGGVLLPLCKGLSAEEYVESLAHVRTLIIEDAEILSRFRILMPQLGTLETVVTIEKVDGVLSIDEMMAEGESDTAAATVQQRRNMVTTDDVCTLVYYGGGTYARLTHRMILKDIDDILAAETDGRRTSRGDMALCTRYGRASNYASQLAGGTVCYTED